MIQPELLHIDAADTARHALFHAFVPLTFRSVDFRHWDARGGWDADYDAFLLRDAGEIVASVGCSRMRLWIDGRRCEGYQFGAVATRPQRRGQGHSRRLLEQVLARIDAEGKPVLLFANERVRDFYPRFGFRPLPQQRYGADCSLPGDAPSAPRCDPADAAARAQLQALCQAAEPNDTVFGVSDYYGVLLWHLTYRPLRAHWLAAGDALAVVSQDQDTLFLHDLLARRPFDLAATLPVLAQGPVRRIVFGFAPQRWWPQAQNLGVDDEASPLFVRGLDTLQPGALRFPELAQT